MQARAFTTILIAASTVALSLGACNDTPVGPLRDAEGGSAGDGAVQAGGSAGEAALEGGAAPGGRGEQTGGADLGGKDPGVQAGSGGSPSASRGGRESGSGGRILSGGTTGASAGAAGAGGDLGGESSGGAGGADGIALTFCRRLQRPVDLVDLVRRHYFIAVLADCNVAGMIRNHIDELDLMSNDLVQWSYRFWGCTLPSVEQEFGIAYRADALSAADAQRLIELYMTVVDDDLSLSPSESAATRIELARLARGAVVNPATEQFSLSVCEDGSGGAGGGGGAGGSGFEGGAGGSGGVGGGESNTGGSNPASAGTGEL